MKSQKNISTLSKDFIEEKWDIFLFLELFAIFLITSNTLNVIVVFFSIVALVLTGVKLGKIMVIKHLGKQLSPDVENQRNPILTIEEILRRYKLLTDNLAAAVIIKDKDDNIIYASPFTEVLTGYSLRKIMAHKGDFFKNIVKKEQLEHYLKANKIAKIGEPFQYRYQINHKSGIDIWIETRTVSLFNETGEVDSTLSISFDVTGLVRYQKQVEEQNKDLKDFTYMISHDLKSPIYTIKGMVTVFEEEFKETADDKIIDLFAHIKKATSRLEKLVFAILDYSKIAFQEATKDKVELKNVIDEVINDYKSQLPSDANFLLPEIKTAVLGDRNMLYQVFSNLIGNSIKYRSSYRPLQITISIEEDENLIFLFYRDNGKGIDPQRKEFIFRPFQRASGSDIEGSGIGLASVKKMMEKMQGSISLVDTSEEGSVFKLEFLKSK